MQLHALDHLGRIVSAQWAQKKTDYLCLECKQHVRLRKGLHRQAHFYHMDPIQFCRQHQKGAVHLKNQLYFFQQLPPGDCQLEMIFPTIGRVADVAWLSQKIVFEIQCSPISAEEALSRNRDYQKEGWSVIWILHDDRFNQVRLSAVEVALRSSPHYFSNIDAAGKGFIYDQFDCYIQGIRQGRLPPLPLDLKKGVFVEQKGIASLPVRLLHFRSNHWSYFFAGDLMSVWMHKTEPNRGPTFKRWFSWSNEEERLPMYLQMAKAKEREIEASIRSLSFCSTLKKAWRMCIVHPYQVIFHHLLERFCR